MWKWIRRLLLIGLLAGAGFVAYDWTRSVDIPEMKVPGKLAATYVEISEETGVPWPVLAAADEVERGYRGVDAASIRKRAQAVRRITGPEPGEREAGAALEKLLAPGQAEKSRKLTESYAWAAASLGEHGAFPFAAKARVDYGDTWGASRTYGGDRPHEGTDLFAKEGTPIRSVSDGRVVGKGWNELGGWRLSVMDGGHSQISYYYAHLSDYADGLSLGSKVKKGQVIGFVGDSGYGPEGTTGKFAPHLHFGIYVRESRFSPGREAVNPYAFLRSWENR